MGGSQGDPPLELLWPQSRHNLGVMALVSSWRGKGGNIENFFCNLLMVSSLVKIICLFGDVMHIKKRDFQECTPNF